MMMYSPTTNITARSTMTALTIQCAWSNRRGMSRFAASVDAVDAAENPGIISIGDSMHSALGSNRGCRATGAVAWVIRVAIVTLCLPVHGCDMGSGGAVELSWKLRPASSPRNDKFVDCQPDPTDPTMDGRDEVTWVRLVWNVAGGNGWHHWTRDEQHGATRFEIPAGTAELSVVPECCVQRNPDGSCGDSQPAVQGTYIAPAPLERKVNRGEVVSLGAVELVVTVNECASAPMGSPNHGTQACICPRMN